MYVTVRVMFFGAPHFRNLNVLLSDKYNQSKYLIRPLPLKTCWQQMHFTILPQCSHRDNAVCCHDLFSLQVTNHLSIKSLLKSREVCGFSNANQVWNCLIPETSQTRLNYMSRGTSAKILVSLLPVALLLLSYYTHSLVQRRRKFPLLASLCPF